MSVEEQVTSEDAQQGPWMPEDLPEKYSHLGGVDALAMAGISERRRELVMETDESGTKGMDSVEYKSLGRAAGIVARHGIAGMKHELELQQQSLAPLPNGYMYDTSLYMDSSELDTLLKASMGPVEGNYADFESVIELDELDNFNVGVRTTEGALIGYGRLLYKDGRGELLDFMVDPGHRRQGIGKAIIDTRIAMAETSGVTSLYIPRLAETNTVASYYLEKGFQETGTDALVRGPDPKRLSPSPDL
jgi:GNAT superfamily N-acetyltransferase